MYLGTQKSLKLNTLGGGGGGVEATLFFGVSGDVQCDKSVYLCTHLTDLHGVCVCDLPMKMLRKIKSEICSPIMLTLIIKKLLI